MPDCELVDVGSVHDPRGVDLPVLLTPAAYDDVVRWTRTDVDADEDARMRAIVGVVADLYPHVCQHPRRRFAIAVRRVLDRMPNGTPARGTLPTPARLTVGLGFDDVGAPVLIADVAAPA